MRAEYMVHKHAFPASVCVMGVLVLRYTHLRAQESGNRNLDCSCSVLPSIELLAQKASPI